MLSFRIQMLTVWQIGQCRLVEVLSPKDRIRSTSMKRTNARSEAQSLLIQPAAGGPFEVRGLETAPVSPKS